MYEEHTELGTTNIYPFVDSEEQLRKNCMSWRLTVDSEGIIREGTLVLDEKEIDKIILAYSRAIEIRLKRKNKE